MSVDLAQTARLLVSDLLTTMRAPMLSRRFQQAVAAATGPVKVNVGAGTVILPGWINTDVLWRSDMYLDLTKPWPVPPGGIDRIYGDNVIEHFSLEAAREVLRSLLFRAAAWRWGCVSLRLTLNGRHVPILRIPR